MMEDESKNVDQKTSYSNDFDAICKTEQARPLKYRFLWIIEKFSELSQSNGDFIESCDLIYRESNVFERKWRLRLYPNGKPYYNDRYEGKLSLDLINHSSCSVNATYEISAFDKTKRRHNTVKAQFHFLRNYSANRDNESLLSFAERSVLGQQLLPDDTLSIVCEITEENSRRILSMADERMEKSYPMNLFNSIYHKEFVKDMNNVFTDKENGYNFIINCGDQVFYCHKFMLSARSPVFQAMFQSGLAENEAGSVEIEDIKPNVMIEMLRYIYSGCTLAVEIYGRELLAAADKYQLDKLKNCCEEFLFGTLNVENCIDLILLGDINQAKSLKKAALEFFTKNLRSSDSGDWKNRLKEHPILAVEVMECLFSKKN